MWQNFLDAKFHPPEHILSLLDVLLHSYVIKDKILSSLVLFVSLNSKLSNGEWLLFIGFLGKFG